jgi:hypothetical protein
MRDGYTDDDVSAVLGRLGQTVGLNLICVWDYVDTSGRGATPTSSYSPPTIRVVPRQGPALIDPAVRGRTPAQLGQQPVQLGGAQPAP